MGSKRLLWDLSQDSAGVQGLKLDMIDKGGRLMGMVFALVFCYCSKNLIRE
jgi:hypothetical protein